MWTEALAVVIIVLANVVCYIAHERSLLHGHLKLPKILFASNRSSAVQSRSRTYWAFDILEPEHLVTSFWLSDTGLLLLRCIEFVFFAVTLTLEATTGDGFGSRPETWWTYFTNWTFILFAVWCLLGIYISAAHVQAKVRACDRHQALEAYAGREEDQNRSGNDRRWSVVLKLYCLISECNAASTLFLSAFFWGFVARQEDVAIDNLLKHGVNNFFILLDVVFSRVPFVSYHYQVILIYGTVYLVFMFIYHGASTEWVYSVLDWDKPSSLGLYVFLPLALFIAFVIWYWIALLRELPCKRCQPPRNTLTFLASPAEAEPINMGPNQNWPSHANEDTFDTQQMLRSSPHPKRMERQSGGISMGRAHSSIV
ncbi:hypothetical protein COCOBI_08-6020 [Coccomyxa sp. Obi]|nr:hypothetical protein COCOBI_08-6020 [Coccomyxa sp. Obi]